jgi:hypothetical protein
MSYQSVLLRIKSEGPAISLRGGSFRAEAVSNQIRRYDLSAMGCGAHSRYLRSGRRFSARVHCGRRGPRHHTCKDDSTGTHPTIYGTNLGPPSGKCSAVIAASNWPTEFCGTQVFIGGIPTELLFVSDNRSISRPPRFTSKRNGGNPGGLRWAVQPPGLNEGWFRTDHDFTRWASVL